MKKRIIENIDRDIWLAYQEHTSTGMSDREARFALTEEFGESSQDDHYASFIDYMYDTIGDDPLLESSVKKDKQSLVEAFIAGEGYREPFNDERYPGDDIPDFGSKDKFKSVDWEEVMDREDEKHEGEEYDSMRDPNNADSYSAGINFDETLNGEDEPNSPMGDFIEGDSLEDKDEDDWDDEIDGMDDYDDDYEDQTNWDDADWEAHEADIADDVDPHSMDFRTDFKGKAQSLAEALNLDQDQILDILSNSSDPETAAMDICDMFQLSEEDCDLVSDIIGI
jgi:hypothetical protein